jgi:hypothetical protein
MGKCYVLIHDWGVNGDCGQDVVAVFGDNKRANEGFTKYIRDAKDSGYCFLAKVLDNDLQRREDVELETFIFEYTYYRAESKDGELRDEIWIEEHELQ